MQDLRPMTTGGSGGGRIFGGDRRLRPYPNQPLKCPRCDSLNTKFCYYNNYNLSQPRHFCKSCRRYWTKGGVLRNVPVGGGCRKTKRSKPKPSPELQSKERKSTTSYSSSESSSLTAATTAATNGAATTEATTENFPDSRLLGSQPLNPNFEPSILDNFEQASDCTGIFTSDGGNLTSLMSVPNPAMVGFNFSAEISPSRLHHHHHQHHEEQQEMEQIHELQQEKMMMMEELKMQEITAGLQMPGFQKRPVPSNGELTASEWQLGSGYHDPGGLLDLPSSVDHGYWSRSHWVDHGQHLYLSPEN